MGKSRGDRMADQLAELIGSMPVSEFTSKGRHHDSAYGLPRLRDFGQTFMPAVLRGEVGVSSVKAIERQFKARDALIRAFFEQADQLGQLNFIAASVIRVQMSELVRELRTVAGPRRIIWVRTQPTSPLKGVRRSFRGHEEFGLSEDRKTGTFDSIYATYLSPGIGGSEQSINLGGLVPSLDKDRAAHRSGDPMVHLSPLQRLGLSRPTEAMFRHAGAVDAAARLEIPPNIDADQHVFLQGRYEGPEERAWLASPAHTVPIVSEPGYQSAAREALGNSADIIVEAEGLSPDDRGLERRHEYVRPNGDVVSNRGVREVIDRGLAYRLDSAQTVAHRGLELMLMAGELRAGLPGKRFEGGQGLLLITDDGDPRWFVVLNKGNGRAAWNCSSSEKRERLQRLVEAFAMLEAADSNAGSTRREQYMSLRIFNVPMSHPSGRENVWRIAAAVRQSRLPDAPLGAALV